jgi:hypothetical protein
MRAARWKRLRNCGELAELKVGVVKMTVQGRVIATMIR